MRNLVLIVIVGLLVVSCATSPLGRRQLMTVSAGQMDEMGVASFTELKQKTPTTKNAKTSAYVSCISRAITAELNDGRVWEVQVFEEDQVNSLCSARRQNRRLRRPAQSR